MILCRHGETDSNAAQIYQGQGDGKLTKKGIEQAKALAKTLSKIKIDSIYCSDLSRSFETASAVARSQKKSAIKDLRLKERFYGKWEGMRFDEIIKEYPVLYKTWMKDPDKARIPGVEPLKTLQKRGVSAINSILSKNKGKTVLAVAHGGINRTILFHFLGIDLNYFWRIKQDNCCMNAVLIDEKTNTPKVLFVNYVPLEGIVLKRLRGDIY